MKAILRTIHSFCCWNKNIVIADEDGKSVDTCLLSVEAVVEVVGFVNHQDLAPGFLQHGVGLLLRLADD